MRRGFLNSPPKKSSQRLASPDPDSGVVYNEEEHIEWARSRGVNINLYKEYTDSGGGSDDETFAIKNITYDAFEGSEKFQGYILALKNLLRMIPTTPSPPLKLALENAYTIAASTTGGGRKMVATRPIAPGQIILVEHPALIHPQIIKNRYIDGMKPTTKLFHSLEGHIKEEAFRMYNCKPEGMCDLQEGIFRTNGLGIDLASSPELSTSLTMHSGLFLKSSMINHSCGPNATYKWDLPSMSITILAVRAIDEGEEITITYIDGKLPYTRRQEILRNAYYFTCTCKHCLSPSPASDAARVVLGKFQERLASTPFHLWLTDLSIPEDRLIKVCMETIRAVEQESLQADTRYRFCHVVLARVYEALGDEENFEIWALKVAEAERISGNDRVALKWKKKLVKRDLAMWGVRKMAAGPGR